ncbi:MAG TPA: LPS export ABC transporter periplasmic protein LptC [bacterium]|nr:LPS export ABC transporter periplasmic protein LptC [bacterium]
MTQHWTTHLRRAALWAVPGVLLAALLWSLLPRGGGEPMTPPALPGGPAHPGSAAASGGGPGRAPAPSVSAGSPAARSGTPAPRAPSPAAQAAPQPGAAARPGGGGVAGEIKLGNLVGTDRQGHMRWQIVADDMVLQQPRQMVTLTRVRATFFNSDGTRMLVNGDRGTYDTRTREITVGGDVHGVASNGRELFADIVSYSPQSREVEGRGHVRVVQERVIMYADRMISDLTLGQTRFFGNVHMSLR